MDKLVFDKLDQDRSPSIDDTLDLYSDPSVMLQARMTFALSVSTICKLNKHPSLENSIDYSIAVFKWRRGSVSFADFTGTLPMQELDFDGYWGDAVKEYNSRFEQETPSKKAKTS